MEKTELHSPFDAVTAALQDGRQADAGDVELLAMRATAAAVELSPYMKSLLEGPGLHFDEFSDEAKLTVRAHLFLRRPACR